MQLAECLMKREHCGYNLYYKSSVINGIFIS